MLQPENQKPVVLAIGGLDPSGGAGITLDSAAIRATGSHPATVAAVITEQSGRRFLRSRPEDAADVERAARLIQEEMDVKSMKLGALSTEGNVSAAARIAGADGKRPVVLDPVIRSSTGGSLLDDSALAALKTDLLPNVHLITPNLHETEILTTIKIRTREEMVPAARRLLEMGAGAVLVKGGHLPGETAVDLLMQRDGTPRYFESERTVKTDVRGTGCALASLIAGYLAQGYPLVDAVVSARTVLQEAIRRHAVVGPGNRVLCFDVTCPTARYDKPI